MQSTGAVKLRGTRIGGPRLSATRITRTARRAIIVRAAQSEDDQPPQGGLQALFASLVPKPRSGGTQKQDASSQGGLPNLFAGFGGTARSSGRPDAQTVFVAGSTGRLGIRVVRELAAAGFSVRAGVRNEARAEAFAERLEALEEPVGGLSPQDAGRIKVVLCDLADSDTIPAAIGDASRVVCCVGAAESEFTDLSAPRRIDFEGTQRLIEAAAAKGIAQFVLVTSLGTGKFGLPAGVLNLFGGVLIWKRKAEEALERSGMPYCIVRPGGMERPKDDHKLTHNVRLVGRDSLFGGTVSRLQVAELIAAAVAAPQLAENKVLEVVAEKEAPLREFEELLAGQRTEIVQEERKEALARTLALRFVLSVTTEDLEEGQERLGGLRAAAAELQAEVAEARAAAAAAQKEQGAVLKEAERAEAQLAQLQAQAEQSALLANAAKAVALEAQRAQREVRVLTRQEIAAVRDSVLRPPVEEEEEEEKEAAPGKAAAPTGLFAGFFGAQQAAEEEVEEEVEEEMEVVVESAPAAAFGSLVSNFFGGGQAAAEEEAPPEVEVVEEEEEEEEAPPANGMSQFFRSFSFASLVQQPQEEEVGEEEQVAQPAPRAAAVAVQEKPAPAPVAEEPAAPEEPVAAAKAPAFQMPQFPSFSLPQIDLERQKATATKWAGEARAAAVGLVEAAQEQAAQQEQAARDTVAPTPAPAPVAVAAPSPAADAAAASEDLPSNVAEARAWIAAWREASPPAPAAAGEGAEARA